MKIFKSCLFGACLLGFVACSSDKAENPDETQKPSGSMEQMTPSESKKFLESTANDFLGKFKAADQQDLIKLAAYVSEKYGDLDMPKEFVIDEEIVKEEADPVRLIRAFARTLGSGNATKAGAASITYTYSLDFDNFKGVYKPSGSRWVKTSNSDHIIFQFTNGAGADCELRAEISSKNSDGSITWSDEYYDYSEDQDVTEDYIYKFRIPKEINITLKENGKELASSKVTSDIDVKGHKFNVTANVTAANIMAAVKLDATDTRVTESASLTVSGSPLLTTEAVINGHNLCDYEFYMEEDDLDNKLLALFENGTASISVLNQVRVDGSATYSQALYDALDKDYYDNYDYATQQEAIKAVTNAVATLNNNLNAEVRYNNTTTVQAKLLWDYDSYEYGSYWEYSTHPLLYFESDGTSYSFEEYFERGFSSVEDTWADLQSSYKKVWDAAVKAAK